MLFWLHSPYCPIYIGKSHVGILKFWFLTLRFMVSNSNRPVSISKSLLSDPFYSFPAV